MDRVAADAFVYAKASGMYAAAFVGARAKRLFGQSHVSDLWTLVFKDEVPLVPEGRLAQLLERRLSERSATDFVSLVKMYDSPDPLSLAFLAFYDCNNIKTACQSALSGAEKPYLVNISPFSRLKTEMWPDIGAMTRNSPYRWFDRIPENAERMKWENRLDNQYYMGLWTAANALPQKDQNAVLDFIREEVVLQNIVWALRLRCYYKMTAEEIVPMLAGFDENAKTKAVLTGPAEAVLEKPLDSFDAWQNWKYAPLLNPEDGNGFWRLDPRWLGLQVSKKLYRAALKRFHQSPFTVGVLASFFKIQRLEEYMVRVATEGIRMGASEDQMNEFVGDFNV